jgi:membrane associated rhomboid family serine protease
VAWWAHIGGFVFGLAAGFLFRLSYLGNNAEEEVV